MIQTEQRQSVLKLFSDDDVDKVSASSISLTNDSERTLQEVSATAYAQSSNNSITIKKGSDGVNYVTNAYMPQMTGTGSIYVSWDWYSSALAAIKSPMIEFDVKLENFDNYLQTIKNLLSAYTISRFSDMIVNLIARSNYFRDDGDFRMTLRPLNDRIHAYVYGINKYNAVASPMPDKFMNGEWTRIRQYIRDINGTCYSILEVEDNAVLSVPVGSTRNRFLQWVGIGGFCNSSSTLNYIQVPYIKVSNIQVTALFETEIDENQKPVELQIEV